MTYHSTYLEKLTLPIKGWGVRRSQRSSRFIGRIEATRIGKQRSIWFMKTIRFMETIRFQKIRFPGAWSVQMMLALTCCEYPSSWFVGGQVSQWSNGPGSTLVHDRWSGFNAGPWWLGPFVQRLSRSIGTAGWVRSIWIRSSGVGDRNKNSFHV